MCCQLDTDLYHVLTVSAQLGLACRILHTLRVRYTLDMIYTYSGNILIAVSSALGSTLHPNKARLMCPGEPANRQTPLFWGILGHVWLSRSCLLPPSAWEHAAGSK